MCEALDRQRLEDVLGRGRQQREHGVGAIFLIMFEPTSKAAISCTISQASTLAPTCRMDEEPVHRMKGELLLSRYLIVTSPFARLDQLRPDVLRRNVSGSNDAEPHGQGGSVSSEPPARCPKHLCSLGVDPAGTPFYGSRRRSVVDML